jgi:X-X-X-Leu-X-X-Gly heptad repeat protein
LAFASYRLPVTEGAQRRPDSNTRIPECSQPQDSEPFNHQPGIGNRQLATGNWQLATGNRQLATGNRQLATGNREPGTGNRELPTGNPLVNVER